MKTSLRWIVALGVAAIAAEAAVIGLGAEPRAAGAKKKALVELYTSQG
jgi:hypothetical protein